MGEEVLGPWVAAGFDGEDWGVVGLGLDGGDAGFPLVKDGEGVPVEFFENDGGGVSAFNEEVVREWVLG